MEWKPRPNFSCLFPTIWWNKSLTSNGLVLKVTRDSHLTAIYHTDIFEKGQCHIQQYSPGPDSIRYFLLFWVWTVMTWRNDIKGPAWLNVTLLKTNTHKDEKGRTGQREISHPRNWWTNWCNCCYEVLNVDLPKHFLYVSGTKQALCIVLCPHKSLFAGQPGEAHQTQMIGKAGVDHWGMFQASSPWESSGIGTAIVHC